MKDIVCRLCGDDFTEADLSDFRSLGEPYHYENGCFICPDCWDSFSRLSLEDQAAELLNGSNRGISYALPENTNQEVHQMSKLHMNVVKEMDLAEIMAGIKSGEIKLSIGDKLTTHFKSGKEVDFVVTDIDGEAYRFESRDCLGRYTPMTRIEDFFSDVWDDLPDEIRDSIIETERRRSVGGEIKHESRRLFLPAASEIFPPASCYGDKGLYEQMDWYKDVHNRVRAFEKGGDADWYWTQSSYSGGTTYVCYVNSYGNANYLYASGTTVAAPVCFRVSRL